MDHVWCLHGIALLDQSWNISSVFFHLGYIKKKHCRCHLLAQAPLAGSNIQICTHSNSQIAFSLTASRGFPPMQQSTKPSDATVWGQFWVSRFVVICGAASKFPPARFERSPCVAMQQSTKPAKSAGMLRVYFADNTQLGLCAYIYNILYINLTELVQNHDALFHEYSLHQASWQCRNFPSAGMHCYKVQNAAAYGRLFSAGLDHFATCHGQRTTVSFMGPKSAFV